MENIKMLYVWGLLRLGMGWIFFWAFIDKLLGLGFATTPEKSWLAGNSPTSGFLEFATKGPLAEFFKSLAGNVAVDWLFMMGLLFVGMFLLLGIGVRIASCVGALMMVLFYLAGFLLPVNNPFMDDHIMYAILLIGFSVSKSGDYLGFGKWWSKTKLVEKCPILK